MPEAILRRLDFSHFQKRSTAHVSERFGVSYTKVVYETHLRGSGATTIILTVTMRKTKARRDDERNRLIWRPPLPTQE